MKEYILSVAGIVLIASALTLIAPAGKTGNFIKGTVRLLILLVMLSPVLKFAGGEELFRGEELPAEDASYYAACARLMERRDEEEAKRFLEEEFSLSAEVDARREDMPDFALEKLTVRCDLSCIKGEEERIYILTRLKSALSERYGQAAELLWTSNA